MLTFETPKDPDEVLDYELDWTARLAGDTIATSTWTISDGEGLMINSQEFGAAKTTVWVSAGTLGVAYQLLNRVITSGGRTFDQTVKLKVRAK